MHLSPFYVITWAVFISICLGITMTASLATNYPPSVRGVGTAKLPINSEATTFRQIVIDELAHINPTTPKDAATIADALIEAERLIHLTDAHHARTPTYDRYDLLALARVESNIRSEAYSTSGARGVMQLMPATYQARFPALQTFLAQNPSLGITPLTDTITDIRTNILVGAYDLAEKRTAVEAQGELPNATTRRYDRIGLIAYTTGVSGAINADGSPSTSRSALRHALYIPLLAEKYRTGAAGITLTPAEIFSTWNSFQMRYDLPPLTPSQFIARMGLRSSVAELTAAPR